MAIYAITGGAGFIGSHLADDLLADGHDVRVLDDLSTGRRSQLDSRISLIVGDVADPAALACLLDGVEAAFHLAAIASVARSNEDWIGTNRVNLGGTVAVLEAARQAGGIPVVYASSAAVYGNQPGPAHEALAPAPRSAYGADKLGSELHAGIAFSVHGVPTFGARFFNIYGPRQDPRSPYSGVISIFAARIAQRQRLVIHGDGQQLRDFVYVDDAVCHLRAGLRLLQDAPQAVVVNVCTGTGSSILELARTLGQIAGRQPEIEFAPARARDIRTSVGDAGRARALLGISANTSLQDGLAATLATTDSRPPPDPAVAVGYERERMQTRTAWDGRF
jgi:UDP-glucose 4-epimerase